ncbi:MAG UNVERIFIED_CONTAM: hypothetical protein LVT10_01610 [Anaerolineae bacterium]
MLELPVVVPEPPQATSAPATEEPSHQRHLQHPSPAQHANRDLQRDHAVTASATTVTPVPCPNFAAGGTITMTASCTMSSAVTITSNTTING